MRGLVATSRTFAGAFTRRLSLLILAGPSEDAAEPLILNCRRLRNPSQFVPLCPDVRGGAKGMARAIERRDDAGRGRCADCSARLQRRFDRLHRFGHSRNGVAKSDFVQQTDQAVTVWRLEKFGRSIWPPPRRAAIDVPQGVERDQA